MYLFKVYNKLVPKKSLAERFKENPKKMVIDNPLWHGNLIPYYPLYRNLFVLKNTCYDIDAMINDTHNAEKNKSWTEKDIYTHNWDSITLKGFHGKDQDFLVETDLKRGNNNDYKYTSAMEGCEYFKRILDSLKTDIYLVRLLKLKAGGKIKFHTDEVVFNKTNDIIRCHIPIITHPNVKFQLGYPKKPPENGQHVWQADVLYERPLYPGYIWFTNVNTLHGVTNNSDKDRIHLVIDMRPSKYFYDKMKE